MSRQVLVLGLLSMLMVGGSCGSACVNFDGQTVRAHVDAERDRLDVLLLYRNLHSTSPGTSSAIAQLEEIRAGARWFALLSNFPFAFHVERLAVIERDPEQPAANRLLQLLAEHVTVRNGDLWLDATGRLSAWQLVRVDKLSAVLEAANAAVAEQVHRAFAREDGKDLSPLDDEASATLLAEALERGDPFWAFDGQALTFTVPASDEGWSQIKRELLDGLRNELDARGGGDSGAEQASGKEDSSRNSAALIEFLAVNEWSVERKPDRAVFVLGLREADELRIEAPTIGLEGTELVDALRERDWVIADLGDDDAAHRAYEAFRSEN